MKKILLPRGLKNLTDSLGREVHYDIPVLDFTPGSGEGTLEQLTLSLYFRGGEGVIERPYVVRLIEQPLTNFFANQLSIRAVEEQPLLTLDDVAKYLASEHVLVVPSLCSGKVSELQNKYEQALESLRQETSNVDEIFNRFSEAILPGARIRVPEIIALYKRFQKEYKNHNSPRLLVNFDYLRRTVERSLQGTQNSSKDTFANLSDEFDAQPNLRTARLLDVFARQHVLLGFEAEKEQFYSKVRDSYQRLVNMHSPDTIFSAYASLIVFDLLLEDKTIARGHLAQLKKLKPHPKIAFIEGFLAGQKEPWPSTSKLGMIGLQQHYHPKLLDILLDRIKDYSRTRDYKIPFPVDVMEDFMAYAKRTRLRDIAYKRVNGYVYRCLVFNQNPYTAVPNQTEGVQLDDAYVIKQAVGADYFGLPERIGRLIGKDPMKNGRLLRLFREPRIDQLYSSSIDAYLGAVPEIQQEGQAPGSGITAALPTRPRLLRAGLNGTGQVEERLQASKIS